MNHNLVYLLSIAFFLILLSLIIVIILYFIKKDHKKTTKKLFIITKNSDKVNKSNIQSDCQGYNRSGSSLDNWKPLVTNNSNFEIEVTTPQGNFTLYSAIKKYTHPVVSSMNINFYTGDLGTIYGHDGSQDADVLFQQGFINTCIYPGGQNPVKINIIPSTDPNYPNLSINNI